MQCSRVSSSQRYHEVKQKFSNFVVRHDRSDLYREEECAFPLLPYPKIQRTTKRKKREKENTVEGVRMHEDERNEKERSQEGGERDRETERQRDRETKRQTCTVVL
jgi:hypothetical protein